MLPCETEQLSQRCDTRLLQSVSIIKLQQAAEASQRIRRHGIARMHQTAKCDGNRPHWIVSVERRGESGKVCTCLAFRACNEKVSSEPRLADACLATHKHCTSAAVKGRAPMGMQQSQFGFPPNKAGNTTCTRR
jgi:hypothetical protein